MNILARAEEIAALSDRFDRAMDELLDALDAMKRNREAFIAGLRADAELIPGRDPLDAPNPINQTDEE